MAKLWKLWASVAAVLLIGLGVVVISIWAKGRDEPASEARLPGDFEPAGSAVLACRELVEGQQTKLLSDLLRAAIDRVTPTLLIDRPSDQVAVQNTLAEDGIDAAKVRFLRSAHDSSRIAQYGPFWVER